MCHCCVPTLDYARHNIFLATSYVKIFLATRIKGFKAMANLPSFSPFGVHADEQSAGPRWRKCVDRFENLLCALDINDEKEKGHALILSGRRSL